MCLLLTNECFAAWLAGHAASYPCDNVMAWKSSMLRRHMATPGFHQGWLLSFSLLAAALYSSSRSSSCLDALQNILNISAQMVPASGETLQSFAISWEDWIWGFGICRWATWHSRMWTMQSILQWTLLMQQGGLEAQWLVFSVLQTRRFFSSLHLITYIRNMVYFGWVVVRRVNPLYKPWHETTGVGKQIMCSQEGLDVAETFLRRMPWMCCM